MFFDGLKWATAPNTIIKNNRIVSKGRRLKMVARDSLNLVVLYAENRVGAAWCLKSG